MFSFRFSTVLFLSVACNKVFGRAQFEKNPFLSGASPNLSKPPSTLTKDVNQWNVQVVLPPGGLPHQPPQSGQPPPGYVWLQVPINQIPNKPDGIQTIPPQKDEIPSQNTPTSTVPAFPGIQQPIGPQVQTTQAPPYVTTTGSELSKRCPRPTGQFPSSSCNKFINCWNGVAVEQACPDGLLFSASGYCDYPERVSCNGRPAEVTQAGGQVTQKPLPVGPPIHVTQIPLTGGELNKNCLKPRGQFPVRACNKFVNCWDGVAIEQFCPDALLFNPIKNHCDYAENVRCNGPIVIREGSSPVVAISGDVGSSTASPTASQSSQAPTSWISSPITLPPPTATTLSGVDPALRNKCLKSRGQFPSTNCKNFVNCWDDIVIEQECPEGFLFSTNGYCEYSQNVDCGNRLNTFKVSNTKSECPLETGTFRERNKCNSYYTCVSNKIVARYDCPEGFSFNDYIGVCDYSDRVDCSKEPLIFQVKKNVAPQFTKDENLKLVCPFESGTFRDPNNCSFYYTCISNNVVAKYQCPEGFSFSDHLGVCDYANRVECSKEPVVFQSKDDILFQVTNGIKVSTECAADFGLFRDRENCRMYYTCVSQKVVAKYECPPGFSFNDENGVCDSADIVDCTRPPKIFQKSNNLPVPIPNNLMEKISSCTPGTTLRLNQQCSSACLCRNGMAEIVQCPTGLAYDSKLDKCVLPHLARC